MTAFVAVSLTLINPYVFKIVKSFLLWSAGRAPDPAVTESSHNSQDESTRLLSMNGQINGQKDYRTFSRSNDAQHDKTHTSSTQIAGSSKGKNTDKRVDSDDDQVASRMSLEHPQRDGSPATAPEDEDTHHDSASKTSAVPDSECAPDSSNELEETRSPGSSLSTPKMASSSRDAVWNSIKISLRRGSEECDSPSLITIVITTVLFGVVVAQAVAEIFSAKIASDRAGVLSSQHCGIWEYDEDAGEEAAYREDVLNNYGKEARASQYVKTCYDSSMPSSLFSCGVFYNQSIAFDTLTSQPCPFASPDMCHGGLYSAIKFDTGLIDASIIGVNTRETHKFRRTTSCAPLNMSETYVRESHRSVNDTYDYFYGRKRNGPEYTFSTSGRPFEWLAPVYSVK